MTKQKNALSLLVPGVLAGAMIALGGACYLACADHVVGALLFTVGLCTICTFGLALYTGKVGYFLPQGRILDTLAVWLGNLIGTAAVGVIVRLARPTLAETAAALTLAKLDQPLLEALLRAVLCGVLMYVAVETYRRLPEKDFARYLGILLCVPAFILCGFEHSIADMAYFAVGATLAQVPQLLVYLLVVSLGNAAGAVLFHLLLPRLPKA